MPDKHMAIRYSFDDTSLSISEETAYKRGAGYSHQIIDFFFFFIRHHYFHLLIVNKGFENEGPFHRSLLTLTDYLMCV